MGRVSAVDRVLSGDAVLGPRTTSIRHLLGQPITETEQLTDMSEFGLWGDYGPLATRPPELWVDRVHDAAYGGEG